MRALRHRFEYWAVCLVRTVVGVLPQQVSLWLGAGLGLAFYLLDGPHRRLAIRNLTAAFPTRSPAELRALARRVFAHFGRLLVEVLRFSRLSEDAIRGRFEVEGGERLLSALSQGKGALLVAGHFGFWELQALVHGTELPPIALVARPLDNPLLHDLLERARTRTGNTVIYRRGGLRRILRALASNQAVAVLIDQHIQTADAVSVEFFDRPAATTAAVATLALRTGAPVIPLFALPLPGGRYRMVYEHAVLPPGSDSPDRIREFTQRCTDVLEMYVRRYPELWLWMHRRWREEVSAEQTGGMFPAGAEDAIDHPQQTT